MAPSVILRERGSGTRIACGPLEGMTKGTSMGSTRGMTPLSSREVCLRGGGTPPPPFARIGEASHPGPNGGESDEGGEPPPGPEPYCIIVANVTHLGNNAPKIKQLSFDALLATEHSIPSKTKAKHLARYGKGFKLHLTPLDPEKQHAVGGVACVLRTTTKYVVAPQPALDETAPYLLEGRLGMYAVHLGGGGGGRIRTCVRCVWVAGGG